MEYFTGGGGDGRSRNAGTGEARRRVSPDVAAAAGPVFRFQCGDGIGYLARHRWAGDELVYCDPPYMLSTRSGRRLYRCEMSDGQHRALLAVICRLKCGVMISGYWSRVYAEALAGWNRVSFQAMTRAGRTATEWVWYNFAAPVELHDYRYLGADYRERERIKRKKLRWAARLRGMPVLERQALLGAILEVSAGVAVGPGAGAPSITARRF